MAKAKTLSALDLARRIRERKNQMAMATAAKKKAKKSKVVYLKKSQTNKSIRKGEQKLRGMSKAQIEKLRAKLRAQKKAKKAKKK